MQAVLAAFGNKPAEIPWTEWHGGECPLKDEEVEEWGCELRDGRKHTNVGVNSAYWRWQHLSRHDDIIAYRVTKWKEGFGPVDWKARAEKAEAELANWKEAAQVAKWQRDLIIDESTDKTGRILELEKLSTLRPIAEAGEVPDGCVRLTGGVASDGYWEMAQAEASSFDTHFVDVLLPESKAHAVEAVKPTPSTFTAHGKEWTPAVGNVVTLKSGSPKMTVTVLSVHKDNASVSWFNDGVVNSASFNVSTLIPA